MEVSWGSRVLLVLASFAAFSKGTVEIPNRIRLITTNDDIGGGRVEVHHDNQWGTICDKNWGLKEAMVVCKELGYKTALYPGKNANFGQGSGPIFMSNVNCSGIQHSILECAHDGWGQVGSCTHGNDAGVRCLKEDSPVLKYLGCWIDNPHDRILNDKYSDYRGGRTDWHNLWKNVLGCAVDAVNSAKDLNLFAVQYYGECWSEEGNPDYQNMKAAPNACKYGVGEKSHNAVYGFEAYYDLGCWSDKPGNGRTMALLQSFRGSINWFDLGSMVTACYNLAKAAGKTYFAVQFYGECWVSDEDEKYKIYGQATNCYQGVGARWSNYVYRIRT